jgi:hypothetical protein
VDARRSRRGRHRRFRGDNVLLTIASGAKPGTDRANSRLDAVRTGLAAGAGKGFLPFDRARVLSPVAELVCRQCVP